MSATPDTHPHDHPFHGLDASVERVLGADMRLIYGFAVPILMVIGLIIVLALKPETWLVISILLLELAGIAVVLYGFVGMLNEPEEDDSET